jgi:glycosyltransferase involved in cell wall biosynthesis
MKLSVIIPSYKDPLMVKTIQSLLSSSKLGGKLEIIAVLDGYWPEFKLVEDSRVRYVHLGKNRGMRESINAGVSIARGEYLMRTDEHCLFAKGFDKEMTDSCQSNWIMTARRFFLDPKKWAVMEDQPYVDYEKLVIQDGIKFAGQRWRSRDKERKNILIDETLSMQGSVWVMSRSWWDKVIKELQTEGYGPLYGDSHEMVFKTWKANGHLMLNKKTWFAHKHRSFSRTHNDGTKENPADKYNGWAYSLGVWREYYESEIRPKWGV